MSDDDAALPPEAQAVIDQLERLRGVVGVALDLLTLDGIQVGDLGLSAYAKHPITALRRTQGGLKDEGVLQIEVSLARSEDGWRALEFLAWFLRDQSRGGDANQLRPFALPPVAGRDVQLGRTMTFLIELFESDPTEGAPLRRLTGLCKDLKLLIDLYDYSLRDRGDSGLT